MIPVLFKIGPLTLHTYGLLAAVGLLVGVMLSARRAHAEGMNGDLFADLGFYLVVAAIVGSRLMYVVVEYPVFIADPLKVFRLWEGGLVFYGGLIAAIPVGWWFVGKHRLDFWRTADVFAPYLALAHAIGRLGCLAAGCCFGRPAPAWIGVVFRNPLALAPLNTPLYPTQLFDSFNELLIFFILLAVRTHKKFNGQLILMWLVLYSLGRFAVEIFRGDDRGYLIPGVLSTSQAIAVPVFLVSLGALVYFLRNAGGKGR